MAVRRLPGVRFEAQPPPPRDTLPRMDIAVFVGFAASGPLDCPVPVEDPARLAAIFGDEAALFRDEGGGELVRGRLLPAARAFLRNGGRRCWVVRVADPLTARTNRHPLPGLMQARLGRDGAVVAIGPAFAVARSEGSWSDGLWTGAALTTTAPVVLGRPAAPTAGELELVVAGEVRPGDLLRLSYPGGLTAMVAVGAVTPAGAPEPPARGVERLRARGVALWLAPAGAADLEGAATATCFLDPAGVRAPVLATGLEGEGLALTLGLALPDAPAPGSLIRVETPGGPLWVVVAEALAVELVVGEGAPPVAAVRVTGQGVRWIERPGAPPAATPLCELLSLELATRAGEADPLRLASLGMVAGAERWWGALPSDSELFGPDETPARERHAALWRAAASPRFPLAGPGPEVAFTFPLAPGQLPVDLLRIRTPTEPPLRRDGLASFGPWLFLDAAFDQTLTADLLARADYLRYLAPTPRRLRGVHAALAVEEATLLAAPDVTARPWGRRRVRPVAPAETPDPILRPAWWGHPACAAGDEPLAEPVWEHFLDAAVAIVAAPTLSADTPDAGGSFTLRWSAPGAGARFILDEATRPGYEDARTVYEGPASEHTMYGRSDGDYYYRVRAIVGPNTSDWSAGLPVRVGAAGGWARDPVGPPPNFDLLAIHRSMLRLCAARGDMLAVLSLPEHYREDEAIAHAAALRPARVPVFRDDDPALPLGYGEAVALSYGALYHPWPVSRIGAEPARAEPPDGAVCGLIARRTLARGAWIAPANERLSDVVALTPPLKATRWLDLQEAQVNLVRAEPDGAICLSADTLALDPELRPVGVRRLLSLLRRLALAQGQSLAFEPFGPALRRLARRELEGVLADLFRRGAFAGATPETAYQVVIRSTPQDVDGGRLIIELKIAPALPLVFLTVRLVQTGGRVLVSEGLAPLT